MKIENLILENNFLLILLNENQYPNGMYDIVRSFEKTKNKICYVCLGKKYKDVLQEFKKNGIDAKQFVFIDTLSSHYGLPSPETNCVYLYAPHDLELIKHTINTIIERENCSIILIDTVSNLLSYREKFPILKFINSFSGECDNKRIKKLFIALKDGIILEKENLELIKDIMLFADKVIEPPTHKL